MQLFEAKTMTVWQFLGVLKARWRLFALILGAFVGAAVAMSLTATRQYVATASVLVDPTPPRDPLTGGAATEGGGARGEGYMATQIDLVRSERVVLGAVRALRLADEATSPWREAWLRDAAGRRPTGAEFEAWVAEQLIAQLQVSPTRESGVLTVSFKAPQPQMAANVANAIVQSYIDTTLELRLAPARASSAFFDERTRQLREKLEAAQAALLAFQRSRGVLVSSERLDVESARLAELSSQLVVLQAQAAESSSREAQAARQADRLPEVVTSPLVSTLTSELSRQQARLGELTERLGANHPQVQETTASIAKLREQLTTATSQISGSVGVTNAVNQARLSQVRAAVAAQREKLLRLGSQNDEAAVLQRDVAHAQKAYDLVLARATQTGLESMNRQNTIALLKQAMPPHRAASPRVGTNLSLALALGAMLAPCIVLLVELRDRRLRSDQDVTRALGQQLLVVLPKRSSPPRFALGGRRSVLGFGRRASEAAP